MKAGQKRKRNRDDSGSQVGPYVLPATKLGLGSVYSTTLYSLPPLSLTLTPYPLPTP